MVTLFMKETILKKLVDACRRWVLKCWDTGLLVAGWLWQRLFYFTQLLSVFLFSAQDERKKEAVRPERRYSRKGYTEVEGRYDRYYLCAYSG